jgi:hypothetical protein
MVQNNKNTIDILVGLLDIVDEENFITYKPGDLVSLYFDHTTRFFYEASIEASNNFSCTKKKFVIPRDSVEYFDLSYADEVSRFKAEFSSGLLQQNKNGVVVSPPFCISYTNNTFHRILFDSKFFWFSTLTIERKIM